MDGGMEGGKQSRRKGERKAGKARKARKAGKEGEEGPPTVVGEPRVQGLRVKHL